MFLTKTKPRRISTLIISALVALSSSVILFGGTAHAQSVDAEQVKLDLLNSSPIIERHNEIVITKMTQLEKEEAERKAVEDEKLTLNTELGSLKEQIEDLKKRIADKKARVEAERVRAELAQQIVIPASPVAPSVVAPQSFNSSGNLYAPGNCTWYVKNRRGDLPNNLGNANMWYYNASSMGMAVGSTPRVGAVGTTTAGGLGHVVYVEAVNGDMVTISEMNYGGLYNMNTRTVHFSEFLYVY